MNNQYITLSNQVEVDGKTKSQPFAYVDAMDASGKSLNSETIKDAKGPIKCFVRGVAGSLDTIKAIYDMDRAEQSEHEFVTQVSEALEELNARIQFRSSFYKVSDAGKTSAGLFYAASDEVILSNS